MRGRARAGRRGRSRCARSGSSTRPRSARSPRTRRLRVFDGDALVGDMPVTALVDECPVYDLEPVAPERVDVPGAGRPGAADATPARTAARAPRQRQPRLPPLGVRAVRLPGRLAHRAPAGGGRRRGAAAARAAPRSRSRSTATAGASPATRTAARSRPCSSARQPRLRRRRAARPHQLPQLRQPREAPHRLAALARGAPASPTRAARSASRSWAATSRSTTRAGAGPIFPTPVVGLVGELPKAARSGRLGFAQEGDIVALIAGRLVGAGAVGSELAKLRGEAPFGELPQADLGELRALHAAVRQAVRSGALRSAHDVAEGGLAVALAECCLAGGLGAAVDCRRCGPTARRCCSARARARSSSPGRRESLRAFGAAAR